MAAGSPSSTSLLEELALMLRPAGGGIFTVSTGRAEQEELQRAIYQAQDAGAVKALWRVALARIERASVVVLGIPSD